MTLVEPIESEGEVVRDVLEDGGESSSPGPPEQTLEGGADEGQRAGGVGIPEAAAILCPTGIALPVSAFTPPVGADGPMESMGVGLGRTQAGDEVAGGVFDLAVFLVGRLIAHLHQLTSLGEVRGLGIGDDRAHVPLFAATVPAVGFRKRGGAWANCFWANWCKVGWLSRTCST